MKERLIQNQIFAICVNLKDKNGGQKFFNIVPNVFFFDWESDLLAMDSLDRIVEFEIKTTRKDLLEDFKTKSKKHTALSTRKGNIPNSFYFVIDESEYKPEDIPEYAGCYTFRHYVCKERGDVVELFLQNAAPQLTLKTFGLQDSRKLLQSVYFKFWNARIGKNLFQK